MRKPYPRVIVKSAKASPEPHQSRVVDRAAGGTKGLIVAHGMGSGKTLTALLAAEDAQKRYPEEPVLIIAPSSLVSNMKDQAKEHGVGVDFNKAIVTTYDKAVNSLEQLKKGRYGLLILDEAHKIRNKDTKRSSGVDPLVEVSRQTLFLTGTPAYNQPHDLAVLINKATGEKVLPDTQKDFEEAFIGQRQIEPGFFAKNFLGVRPGNLPYLKNVDRLKEVLKKHVDLYDARLEKPENFPAVASKVVKVEMSSEQQRIYNFLEGNIPAHIRWKIRMGLPLSKQESKDLNAFSTGVRQASNSVEPFVASADVTTTPKIKAMADSVVDYSRQLPNFRGFAYSNYLEAGLKPYQKELASRGIQAEILDGTLSPTAKDALVDRYNDGRIPFLLISSTGSEGLNLKGTRLAQVMEPHFNKSKIDQVVARGVRFKSHEHLPEDQRHVQVEYYQSTQRPGLVNKMLNSPVAKGIDEYLTDLSEEKQRIQKEMIELVKTAGDNVFLLKVAETTLRDIAMDTSQGALEGALTEGVGRKIKVIPKGSYALGMAIGAGVQNAFGITNRYLDTLHKQANLAALPLAVYNGYSNAKTVEMLKDIQQSGEVHLPHLPVEVPQYLTMG